MHHTIFTVLWEKLHRVSRSVIKHANEVSRETKKHFPAETMCLGIGQINQNGCYRDQIKLLPHPKGEFFSLHSVPWRHTYNHLGKLPTPLSGGVRASGRYKFSNFGDLTSDQSTRGWNDEAFTPKGIHQESTHYTCTRTLYSAPTKLICK